MPMALEAVGAIVESAERSGPKRSPQWQIALRLRHETEAVFVVCKAGAHGARRPARYPMLSTWRDCWYALP